MALIKKILFSPHNDDEALFASYTLLREKPLVVICTDSYIQYERGDQITAEQRRNETREAMKILGCDVIFLGIKDTELTPENLEKALSHFTADVVYAPAIQGGNAQHDLVGTVANKLFSPIFYTTYTKSVLWTTGSRELVGSPEEMELKNKALDCYTSQINLGSTAPHFEAVRNRSEFYV